MVRGMRVRPTRPDPGRRGLSGPIRIRPAFSAHIWLLQSTSTSFAVTYAYVDHWSGWLILAEPVTVPILIGGVIVVLAVAVVVRSEFQQ